MSKELQKDLTIEFMQVHFERQNKFQIFE